MVTVPMTKSGLVAFVRLKDKTADSMTFEILFSKPVIKSILDSLARETFISDYSTSEYHITIRLKETEHEKCCPKLDDFLKKFDKKLQEASLLLKPLEKRLEKGSLEAES